MTSDAYIPYSTPSPGNPTAADVLAAAENYVNVGAQWAADNCTGLVWAVAYAVGAPFFEPISQVEADSGENQSQIVGNGGIIPDNQHGFDVPLRSPNGSEFPLGNTAELNAVYGVQDTLGSSWQLVNGNASWLSVISNSSPADEPQPGDLLRGVAVNAGAGMCVMHSGIVKSYDPTTQTVTLISNWDVSVNGGVIDARPFKLIHSASQAVAGSGSYIFANELTLF